MNRTFQLGFMKSSIPPVTLESQKPLLEQGCESFRKRAWADAFRQLSIADSAELRLESQLETGVWLRFA